MAKISYQRFIQAAALQYKQHPSEMAQNAYNLLSRIDITDSFNEKTLNLNSKDSFTIDSHSLLPDIIRSKSHLILTSLSGCYNSLNWRPSGFGRLPAEITNHVAVVEIIGPSGMIIDKDFRFGLLLQDPQIHYAKHQHAAEELYIVLSGKAAWSIDDDKLTIRDVGEFIHHAENQPHQMKTNDEPLLAMWAWLGDIDAESYSI